MFMDQILLSAHTAVALLLLWILIFVLRRGYCEDKFRNELFALRDELFDYGDSGAISFGHPAYALLRVRMNGMLRFAHRATLLQSVVSILFFRAAMHDAVEEYRQRWQSAISKVERAEVRLKLLDFQERMGLSLARHLVRSSIIFFAPALIGVIVFTVIRVATVELWKLLAKWIPGFEYLEAEAEQAGAA